MSDSATAVSAEAIVATGMKETQRFGAIAAERMRISYEC